MVLYVCESDIIETPSDDCSRIGIQSIRYEQNLPELSEMTTSDHRDSTGLRYYAMRSAELVV